jgi:RNA polymerase sigma-70 factor (ECF subfamily)
VKTFLQERIAVALNQVAETEAGLIRLAQDGDRNAFGELVRRHYAGVVNVVTRMCGDPDLAQDTAQETFLRAWVNLASIRPEASLRTWLYRIAVNAAVDVLRRRRAASIETAQLQELPDRGAGPEAAVMEKERAVLLRQALGSLPDASRSVLVLREYGELSYQEISQVLNIPVGTVMSRLNYARSRLRETLKDLLLPLENEHA